MQWESGEETWEPEWSLLYGRAGRLREECARPGRARLLMGGVERDPAVEEGEEPKTRARAGLRDQQRDQLCPTYSGPTTRERSWPTGQCRCDSGVPRE